MRKFLAELARSVHRGEIRVIAYSLMTTHFHLAIDSVDGDLAAAMRRIQTAYSRYFNRSRRRDGALVRGRYQARRIDSPEYFTALLAYIDRNPVDAGIVTRPDHYEFGSARHYVEGDGPRWLDRRRVAWHLLREGNPRQPFGADYLRFIARVSPELSNGIVEGGMKGRAYGADVGDLMSRLPRRVHGWFVRKAALADGTMPGLPLCDPVATLLALEREWSRLSASLGVQGWSTGAIPPAAECGVLLDLSGLEVSEIAARQNLSPSHVGRLLAKHRRLVQCDSAYRGLVVDVARQVTPRPPGGRGGA
ncbi:MAG: hypothetical protein R3F20_19160 [Planctomycetota bacterium]